MSKALKIAIGCLIIWIVVMIALKATPAGAQSEPVPTMMSTSEGMPPPPPPPPPPATPTIEATPDDVHIFWVCWLPLIGSGTPTHGSVDLPLIGGE